MGDDGRRDDDSVEDSRAGDGQTERDQRRSLDVPDDQPDGWREVDEEVGLREEPWWEVADDREHVEPPVRPEDRSWHERDEEQRGRVADGPSVERGAGSRWASLDDAQRVVLYGLLALAGLLVVLLATYVVLAVLGAA